MDIKFDNPFVPRDDEGDEAAEGLYHFFVSLQRAGFDEEQALHIVTTMIGDMMVSMIEGGR